MSTNVLYRSLRRRSQDGAQQGPEQPTECPLVGPAVWTRLADTFGQAPVRDQRESNKDRPTRGPCPHEYSRKRGDRACRKNLQHSSLETEQRSGFGSESLNQGGKSRVRLPMHEF